MTRAITLLALYGTCSISLTVLNKDMAIVFPYPWAVILLQHLGSLSCTGVTHWATPVQVKSFRRAHLLPAVLNGLLLTLMLWLSLNALRYTSVALYVLMRNAVPVVVAAIEFMVLGKTLPLTRVLGLCCVVVGAVGFALRNERSEFHGYAFGIGNSLLVGIASVYDKMMATRFLKDQTSVGINLFRVLFSCPMVLLLSLSTESVSLPQRLDLRLMLELGFTSVCAFGIGSIMFELNKIFSATTIQVANMLFKFATILVSLVIWPQHIPMLGWLCIAVSLWGFSVYSLGAPRTAIPKLEGPEGPVDVEMESKRQIGSAGITSFGRAATASPRSRSAT